MQPYDDMEFRFPYSCLVHSEREKITQKPANLILALVIDKSKIENVLNYFENNTELEVGFSMVLDMVRQRS